MTSNHLFVQHDRVFAGNRFVYPVISRRSGGLSLGVNLNPDKICNFDCIYCQVDRTTQSETLFVDTPQLLDELDEAVGLAQRGEIFQLGHLRATPPAWRRFNDIAFSGDGEPTTYRNFDELVQASAEIKQRHRADAVKMVLITNASMFHRPHVRRALEILDAHQGEIWAKLDAGTADYFRLIDRTSIPFSQILQNILAAAQVRPIVIQSLFMQVAGQSPPAAEIDAYCDRLRDILQQGGQIRLVQVYTIARRPAESYVRPLTSQQVDEIVAQVQRATGLPAEPYYGVAGDEDLKGMASDAQAEIPG